MDEFLRAHQNTHEQARTFEESTIIASPRGPWNGLSREAFHRTATVVLVRSRAKLERELELIRQRLDSIEEALADEMTAEDREALSEALDEHRRGRTIPF